MTENEPDDMRHVDSLALEQDSCQPLATKKREMCPTCERPKRVCWCGAVAAPRIHTRTQVLILQHPGECKRAIRTARMLELGLAPGCCHVFRGKKFPGAHGERLTQLLAQPGTYILFPGKNARKLTLETPEKPHENGDEEEENESEEEEEIVTVVILDGTWDQAKKMFVRNPVLQKLPQVMLDVGVKSEYVVRTQPADGCLSTLESGVYAVAILENRPEIISPLLQPLRALCSIQLNHGAVTHHSFQAKKLETLPDGSPS